MSKSPITGSQCNVGGAQPSCWNSKLKKARWPEIGVLHRNWIAFFQAIGCDRANHSTLRGEHTMKTMYLPRISISLVLFVLAFLSQQAMADVHVWKGPVSPSTDMRWSTASNWQGGRPFDDEAGGTIVEFNSAVSGSNFTSICDIKVMVNFLNFKTGGFTILGDNNAAHELAVSSDQAQLDSENKPQSLRVDGGGAVTIGSSSAAQFLKFKLTGSATETWKISSGSTFNVIADISGATDLDVKAAGGTVVLAGNNVLFSQDFNFISGTLKLDSPAGKTSIGKSVTVGKIPVPPELDLPAVVRLMQNDVLGDDAGILVNKNGTLEVAGVTDTMGGLTINSGGKMTLGNGNLTTRDNLVIDGASVDLGGGTLTCANPLQLLNDASITLGTQNALTGVLNVNDGLAMAGGTISGTGTKANLDVVNLNSDVTATTSGAGTPSQIICKVTLNNATRSFSVAQGLVQPEFVINGVIAEGTVVGAGIIKRDFGTMRITAATANTFTGLTTVDRGTLELNNATGLAIPGALILGNAADAVNTAILRDLADNQILNDINKLPSILKSGQLDLNNHVETFSTITGSGNINLGDGTSGSSTFAGILTLGGSFTFGGDNTDNSWAGMLTGVGSFNKVGAATFTFTGTCPSTGVTMNIKSGRILLNSVSLSLGAAAKLVIGPGTGAANAVSAELVRSNQLPDTGTVVVNSDGLLNLVSSAVTANASSSDVTGSVTINGGTVNIGSAQFEVTGGLNMTAGKVTATNAGNLVTFSTVTASASATTGAVIDAPVALKST
ncbi:MAG: autotransporter-associated beta strand repeat protein, partial [Verrucomicrobiaceae bacterium]|nr:autotransporter-associated beta strand repeat protein [Verrucomicrobiaceae bacterium]